jgi:hypothetical protein
MGMVYIVKDDRKPVGERFIVMISELQKTTPTDGAVQAAVGSPGIGSPQRPAQL